VVPEELELLGTDLTVAALIVVDGRVILMDLIVLEVTDFVCSCKQALPSIFIFDITLLGSDWTTVRLGGKILLISGGIKQAGSSSFFSDRISGPTISFFSLPNCPCVLVLLPAWV